MEGKVYAGITKTSKYTGFPVKHEYEQRRKFGWYNTKIHPSYKGDSM